MSTMMTTIVTALRLSLVALLLAGTLGACVVYERDGYYHPHPYYGYGYYERGHDWR